MSHDHDELGDVLQSLYDSGTGIRNDLTKYDPATAKAAIESYIYKEFMELIGQCTETWNHGDQPVVYVETITKELAAKYPSQGEES